MPPQRASGQRQAIAFLHHRAGVQGQRVQVVDASRLGQHGTRLSDGGQLHLVMILFGREGGHEACVARRQEQAAAWADDVERLRVLALPSVVQN
jgi:hypothetical protein